ncbi:MAG TPA: hypothetical protein VFH31_03175 [Pyrinomonadaceae bacterium]|nr:hypothetical protein [Pyrinomonadaceae bacterium]
MADPRFPTEAELNLIAQDVLITKVKYNDQNIQPVYHKWKDIWADEKLFKVNNKDPSYRIRAIAVTLPMYFLDDPNLQEWAYRGYVAGLADSQYNDGNVQILPLSEISWL